MGTTIKSTATNNAVHVFRCPGGDVLLSLRYGSAIYVRETDLLDALGIDVLLGEKLAEAHQAIGRVKALIENYSDDAQFSRKEIRGAIKWDPRPAFTLPTEPGSGIEADFTDGEKGVTFELRLFSDGVWIDNYGGQWGPEAVLSQMTGHRLIGAES